MAYENSLNSMEATMKVYFIKIIVMTAVTGMLSLSQVVYAENTLQVGYTVQAGAFKDVLKAGRFTDTLKARNLDATCIIKENGLFAVVFGDFATWGQADETARRLKSEKIIEQFYIVAPKRHNKVFSKFSSTREKQPKQTSLGKIAAQTAARFTGIPYHWGGNNVVEGMDCSGFVKAVYYLVGLNIPRTSQEQYDEGATVETDQIMEGDLVFFGKGRDKVSHVGLYLGNNQFIHAPKRGEPVQVTSIKDDRYAVRFVGAKRYLPSSVSM